MTACRLTAVLIACGFAARAEPPPPGVTVAEGWQVEEVARTAVPAKYVAVAPAADGTVFAVEAGHAPGREGYRVRACRVNDGKLVPFADVPASLGGGILAHDGWLYLGGVTIERVRQSKLGGPFDRREAVVRCGPSRVAGLCAAPDGGLAMAVFGANGQLEGSDGRRVQLPQRSAAVLHCRPDGSQLRVVARFHCDRLTHVGYDSLGRGFVCSSAGLLHFAEGDEMFDADDQAGAAAWIDPEFYNRGFAAGTSSDGNLLLAPSGRPDRIVSAGVRRLGASAKIADPSLLLKLGPNESLNGVVAGPRGSVFVVATTGVDGPSGVLRLTPTAARPAELPDLAPLSLDALGDALKTCGGYDRPRVAAELSRRGPSASDVLRGILADRDAPAPARVVAAVLAPGPEALSEGDVEVRRAAAEAFALAAKPRDEAAHSALLALLSDPEPCVRRAAALGIARVGAPSAAEVLVNALRFDETKDARLTDGLLRGLEACGSDGMTRLIELGDSGSERDLATAHFAFTKLRTAAAAAALPRFSANPHLTADQRAKLAQAARQFERGDLAKPAP